jgi:hypothetical protein
MDVVATSALRILIRRRNSPASLRGETRRLIRQAIAQRHTTPSTGWASPSLYFAAPPRSR